LRDNAGAEVMEGGMVEEVNIAKAEVMEVVTREEDITAIPQDLKEVRAQEFIMGIHRE
jgi:hypothetical protein